MERVGSHGQKKGDLFFGIDGSGEDNIVWMSHGDKVTALPEAWESIACTDNSPHAAVAGPLGGHIYVSIL